MVDAATATATASTAFESPLLDVREAAAYLRCKPCTIRSMLRKGVLAAVRIGHKDTIRKTELDHWIKVNEFRRVSRSNFGLTGT